MKPGEPEKAAGRNGSEIGRQFGCFDLLLLPFAVIWSVAGALVTKFKGWRTTDSGNDSQ